MTRTMNSEALVLLDRILGLSGPGGEQYTTLDDGNVQQVIEISDIARRSLTPAGTAGIFNVVIQNNDTSGTLINQTMDLYDLRNTMTLTASTHAYPVPVPRGFDVWLIQASAWTGWDLTKIDLLQLNLASPSSHNAITANQTLNGAPIQSGPALGRQPLVRWDGGEAIGTITGATDVYPLYTLEGLVSKRLNLRIRRGTELMVASVCSASQVEMNVEIIVGVFPEGLGQDIAT